MERDAEVEELKQEMVVMKKDQDAGYLNVQGRISGILHDVADVRNRVMRLNNSYLLGRVDDLFNYLIASDVINKHAYYDWIQEQDRLLGEKLAKELVE